jgi:hypothetical protein
MTRDRPASLESTDVWDSDYVSCFGYQRKAGQFNLEPPRHQDTKSFVLLCAFVVPHLRLK